MTTYEGKEYLFDCAFDDTLDDYPNFFRVYEIPALSVAELRGSWSHLPDLATTFAGVVPVKSVTFDPTKRASIDAAIFGEVFAEQELGFAHNP